MFGTNLEETERKPSLDEPEGGMDEWGEGRDECSTMMMFLVNSFNTSLVPFPVGVLLCAL